MQEEGEEGPTECQVGEGGNNIGRWSQQEHNQFLEGLEKFGKDWRKISTIVKFNLFILIDRSQQELLFRFELMHKNTFKRMTLE